MEKKNKKTIKQNITELKVQSNKQLNHAVLQPQEINYRLIAENEYETIKNENTQLKQKVYELTRDADIYKQQISTDKETIEILKRENEELKNKIKELELKVEKLEETNNKLELKMGQLEETIDILMSERRDRKVSNMLLDVFGYFKEEILKQEQNKYPIINNMPCQEICSILKNVNHKDNADVKMFIKKIGFNPDNILQLHCLNKNRNDLTHLINNKKYKDVKYMRTQIELFKSEINKLNEENVMFEYKNDILEFINTICKFV